MGTMLKKGIGFAAMLVANLACAVPTLHLGNEPLSVEVPYGAKKTAAPLVLQYDLVSDLPNRSQTLKNVTFTSSAPSKAIMVEAITNTCNGVLPPQGSTGVCSIMVSLRITGVQPPSNTALSSASYQLKFTYGNGRGTTLQSRPFIASFATGKKVASANRTFTFKNHCNYDVWFGISAGATASLNPTTPGNAQSCKTDSDCYPGAKCENSLCFWANPPSANGVYKLKALTGSNTAIFPVYDNGIPAVWSGGIAGRTNCTGATCETGDCDASPSGGACAATKGFAAPVSVAEFTLLGKAGVVYTNTPNGNTAVDTYDVTIINGITTPISMTPSTGTWGGRSAPYTCGAAGAASKVQSSAACNWNGFTVPNRTYVFVKFNDPGTGVLACPNGNECTDGRVCGSSFNPAGSVESNKCGTHLGYWTADAICARDATYDNGITVAAGSIQCQSKDDPLNPTATQLELYGCTGHPFVHSCYTAGAQSNKCCGCVDWFSIPGVSVPEGPTESCNGIKSSYWTAYSQPKLEWLKKACPNVYVFPYDDASSTFTCQKLDKAKINVVNYTIDFCPQI